MIDAITLSCYAGGQIDGVGADLEYLERIAGVGEMLPDATWREQPDGRIFAVLA